jgi:hypothetical protein
MKRIVLALAVAIGLGLLAACAHSGVRPLGPYPGIHKGGPRTFVTLLKLDGICQATDGVGTLGGKKNDKITWYVSNYCDAGQYVRFTHYQEGVNPVDPDVVDPDPKDYQIGSGAEDKKAEAHIKKDNNSGADKLYKYWICVSSSPMPNPLPDPLPASIKCLDPDIDVWP